MLIIHDTVKDVGGQPSVNENSVSNDNGNRNAINTLINAEVECDNKMNEGNNGNCSVYIDNFNRSIKKYCDNTEEKDANENNDCINDNDDYDDDHDLSSLSNDYGNKTPKYIN